MNLIIFHIINKSFLINLKYLLIKNYFDDSIFLKSLTDFISEFSFPLTILLIHDAKVSSDFLFFLNISIIFKELLTAQFLSDTNNLSTKMFERALAIINNMAKIFGMGVRGLKLGNSLPL